MTDTTRKELIEIRDRLNKLLAETPVENENQTRMVFDDIPSPNKGQMSIDDKWVYDGKSWLQVDSVGGRSVMRHMNLANFPKRGTIDNTRIDYISNGRLWIHKASMEGDALFREFA